MTHIVLLGDSIFDNASYVRGGLDVIAHLRQQIPPDWRASLKAVDGSVIGNVAGQIGGLPGDTTHLVISAGGNDALMNADILQQKASSSAEVLEKLANVAKSFEQNYERMLEQVLGLKSPTAVCTIYYPRLVDPRIQKIAVAALTVFNDAIIRQATEAGLPLIDLRLVCNEDVDYANEIEPSEAGGKKIAAVITRLVSEHDYTKCRTEIFC